MIYGYVIRTVKTQVTGYTSRDYQEMDEVYRVPFHIGVAAVASANTKIEGKIPGSVKPLVGTRPLVDKFCSICLVSESLFSDDNATF